MKCKKCCWHKAKVVLEGNKNHDWIKRTSGKTKGLKCCKCGAEKIKGKSKITFDPGYYVAVTANRDRVKSINA